MRTVPCSIIESLNYCTAFLLNTRHAHTELFFKTKILRNTNLAVLLCSVLSIGTPFAMHKCCSIRRSRPSTTPQQKHETETYVPPLTSHIKNAPIRKETRTSPQWASRHKDGRRKQTKRNRIENGHIPPDSHIDTIPCCDSLPQFGGPHHASNAKWKAEQLQESAQGKERWM